MLEAEGIPVPSNGPLTKAEERELKRLRRKVKNKLSAKDSRRRRKEHMSVLEVENEKLRERIDSLENANQGLAAQLRRVYDAVRPSTESGGRQHKACVMILCALALTRPASLRPDSTRDVPQLDDMSSPSVVDDAAVPQPPQGTTVGAGTQQATPALPSCAYTLPLQGEDNHLSQLFAFVSNPDDLIYYADILRLCSPPHPSCPSDPVYLFVICKLRRGGHLQPCPLRWSLRTVSRRMTRRSLISLATFATPLPRS